MPITIIVGIIIGATMGGVDAVKWGGGGGLEESIELVAIMIAKLEELGVAGGFVVSGCAVGVPRGWVGVCTGCGDSVVWG